jgi:hypothetical protein
MMNKARGESEEAKATEAGIGGTGGFDDECIASFSDEMDDAKF